MFYIHIGALLLAVLRRVPGREEVEVVHALPVEDDGRGGRPTDAQHRLPVGHGLRNDLKEDIFFTFQKIIFKLLLEEMNIPVFSK